MTDGCLNKKLPLTPAKAMYFFFAAVCFSNTRRGGGEANRDKKPNRSTNRNSIFRLFAKPARRCCPSRLRVPFNERAALTALTRRGGASARRTLRVDDR